MISRRIVAVALLLGGIQGAFTSSHRNNNNDNNNNKVDTQSDSSTSSIPSVFTSGFQPSDVTLQIAYQGKTVANGADLSSADTSKAPAFALGDSSGLSTSAKYIIAMVDPDVAAPSTSPQTLHFLQQDFQSNGDELQLSSSAQAAAPWVAPANGQGSGAHRFVFLLFEQPSNFQMKAVSQSDRLNFDLRKWQAANGLQSAVAGIEFIAIVVGSNSGSNAQTTTTTAAAAASTGSSGTVINVVVGGADGKLVYHPESVTANVGDTVRFDFLAKNHTVTQSTLANPCTFMTGGVKSGFRPNPQNVMGASTFDFQVADTTPKWFFCGQTLHCQKGMVFAINPADKFAQFKAAALALGASAAATTTTAAATTAAATTAAAVTTTSAVAAADTTLAGVTLSVAPPAGTGTGAGSASASTGASAGQRITVKVGGPAGLVYTPEQVTANVGDTIVFDFLAKNHTATQSTLASPCTFMTGGFKSGFQANLQSTEGLVTREFAVTDTKPKWFYCAQTGHCAAGMVFAINPGDKFAQFKAAAMAQGSSASGTGAAGSVSNTTNPTAATSPPQQTTNGASSSAANWGLVVFVAFLSLFVAA